MEGGSSLPPEVVPVFRFLLFCHHFMINLSTRRCSYPNRPGGGLTTSDYRAMTLGRLWLLAILTRPEDLNIIIIIIIILIILIYSCNLVRISLFPLARKQ